MVSSLLLFVYFFFHVQATLVGTVMFATAKSLIQVYPTPLVALIDGGTSRSVTRHDDIIIDASGSFDPDYPRKMNLK